MGHYSNLKLEVAVEHRFRDDWARLDDHDQKHNPRVSSGDHVDSVPKGFDHPLFKCSRWNFNSMPAFYAVGDHLIAVVNMHVKNYSDECEHLLDWMSNYLVFDEQGVPLSWDLTGAYGTYGSEGSFSPVYPVVWKNGHLEIDYETNLNPDEYCGSLERIPVARWKPLFIDEDADDGELAGRGLLTIDHRSLPLRLSSR